MILKNIIIYLKQYRKLIVSDWVNQNHSYAKDGNRKELFQIEVLRVLIKVVTRLGGKYYFAVK